jgi:hypothetical protein
MMNFAKITFIVIAITIAFSIYYNYTINNRKITNCPNGDKCIRMCDNDNDTVEYILNKIIIKDNKTDLTVLRGSPCISFLTYYRNYGSEMFIPNSYSIYMYISPIMNVKSGINNDAYCLNKDYVMICIPYTPIKIIDRNFIAITMGTIIFLTYTYNYIKYNESNEYILMYISTFILKIICHFIIRTFDYYLASAKIYGISISYSHLLLHYIMVISLGFGYLYNMYTYVCTYNNHNVFSYKKYNKYIIIYSIFIILISYIVNKYNIIFNELHMDLGISTFIPGHRVYEYLFRPNELVPIGLVYFYIHNILCICCIIAISLIICVEYIKSLITKSDDKSDIKLLDKPLLDNKFYIYNNLCINIFIIWTIEIVNFINDYIPILYFNSILYFINSVVIYHTLVYNNKK